MERLRIPEGEAGEKIKVGRIRGDECCHKRRAPAECGTGLPSLSRAVLEPRVSVHDDGGRKPVTNGGGH
jgi:hypothetical protein